MLSIKEIIELFNTADSQNWSEMRLRRFTSSECSKLVSDPRSKADKEAGIFGEAFYTYVNLKVGETLTGFTPEFDNEATAHGSQYEFAAMQLYMAQTYNPVAYGSKCFVPYGEHAGGSPDGIIMLEGNEGILEAKCPYNPGKFVELSIATVKDFKQTHKEYYWQLQMNMLICGVEWADLVVYHPLAPQTANLNIKRFEANKADQKLIVDRLAAAIELKLKILSEIQTPI